MPHRVTFLDRVGYQPVRPVDEIGMGFDVIWCQWCLGHLSDDDLVAFLRRSHAALKVKEKGKSLIVVKENLCSDLDDGTPRTVFDEQDSSLTRSV
jgi:protein N-terminal methyltransferase